MRRLLQGVAYKMAIYDRQLGIFDGFIDDPLTVPEAKPAPPPAAFTVTGVDGTKLIAADGGSVVLNNNTIANTGYKTTTSFSSGGPRNPDSAPKPDVIAPGLSVISAGVGTGTGSAVISGTSMACPMTAGIAALVKQVHPTWNGLQIKAAIMNTADGSLNTGYNVRRAGAGVVQAQKAVNSSVLATTPNQLDSIAFGYVPGSGDYTDHKAITLTNTGSVDATYSLSVVTNGAQQGAVVGVSPSSVTVAAGSTQTVQVTLSISASAFAALPSVDTFTIGFTGSPACDSLPIASMTEIFTVGGMRNVPSEKAAA